MCDVAPAVTGHLSLFLHAIDAVTDLYSHKSICLKSPTATFRHYHSDG